MRLRRATALVVLSALIVNPGSAWPAHGSPICTIRPSRVSAEIDPALFSNGQLPDIEAERTQALFHPKVVDLDASGGYVWARTSLTIRGETYRDEVGFPTPLFFPSPSGLYPSAIGWFTAFIGSWQYLFDIQRPFDGVYTFQSLIDDFMDPVSYPIIIEVAYAADSEGSSVCSLAFEFDVQAGDSGWGIDLDGYLRNASKAVDVLPDTA